jgi:histidinol-phosphate aminotransferase
MPILGVKEAGPSKPSHFDLERIIRPNILSLLPYRCARDDYDSGILLDANENAHGPALPSFKDLAVSQPQQNGGAATAPADSILNLSQDELAGLNRYPSPTHDDLRSLIAELRGVPSENWVFLGVGSDEVIDLLYRVSCVPAKDVVITTPPTYGMYKVTANVNDVGVVEVPLITEDGRFEVDEDAVSAAEVRGDRFSSANTILRLPALSGV